MGNLRAFKLSALFFSEENHCLREFFSFRKIVYHVQPNEQLLWLSCTHVSVPIRPFGLTIHCLRFQVSTLFQSSAHRWIHDGVCFNAEIYLVILITICHTSLIVSVGRIWYWINFNLPKFIYFFVTSPIVCWTLHRYCQKKLCPGHSWELNRLSRATK